MLQWYDPPKEMVKIKVEPKAKMKVLKTPAGNLYYHGDMIRMPRCSACLEDFAPGATFTWTFSFDEFHYIMAGKAQLTYSLIHYLYQNERTMTVEAGDAYLIPCGAKVTWKVDKSGPLRKLCVWMPGSPAREVPPEATFIATDYSAG